MEPVLKNTLKSVIHDICCTDAKPSTIMRNGITAGANAHEFIVAAVLKKNKQKKKKEKKE